MKKVITICLLVVTLLTGGMTMDAKTIKNTKSTQKLSRLKAGKSKSSSSGSSFNMKSLVNKVYAMNNQPTFLSISQVKALMKDFGFTYQGSYKTQVTDDYDETYEVDVLKFKKSGVSAEVYVGVKYILKFSNSSQAKEFITASKNAFGNALKKRDSEYLYYKNWYYWRMKQKGSTVTIEVGESMDGGQSYYY